MPAACWPRARRPRSARRAPRRGGPRADDGRRVHRHRRGGRAGQRPRREGGMSAPTHPSPHRPPPSCGGSGAGPQGEPPDRARSQQHRDRHRAAADADPAVRLRAVARRQECAGRAWWWRTPSPDATRAGRRLRSSRPTSTRASSPRCRRPRADARAHGSTASSASGPISRGSVGLRGGAGADARARHRRQPRAHHPGLRPGRASAEAGRAARGGGRARPRSGR